MSFQYDSKAFENARHLPLLVIVDPVRRHLAGCSGLGRTNIGGVVANCHKAIAQARRLGMRIAFMRDYGDPSASWIGGLSPQRDHMVFERRALSCFSSGYFAEVASRAGALVIAGFPGEGGALATAVDAIRANVRATFLQDALLDSAGRRLLAAPLCDALTEYPPLGIAVTATHKWFCEASSNLGAGQMAGSENLPSSPLSTMQRS